MRGVTGVEEEGGDYEGSIAKSGRTSWNNCVLIKQIVEQEDRPDIVQKTITTADEGEKAEKQIFVMYEQK